MSRRSWAVALASLIPPACRERSPVPFIANIPYGPEASHRLDVYRPANERTGKLAPLLCMVHGGGWVQGSRSDMQRFIPAPLEHRFVVANIGYRTAELAPAAAIDVRHAVAFAREHAHEWHADADRMVFMGFSAGAHLALLAVMATESAIPGPQSTPSGVIDFWGITNPADLLAGQNARDFAQRWIPPGPGRANLASRLSPLGYDVPISVRLCAVHSEDDKVVPVQHSLDIVRRWQSAGAQASFLRLRGGTHGAPLETYPGLFAKALRTVLPNNIPS